MITPIWQEKSDMGLWKNFIDRKGTTENKLIRLVFHDCVTYEDGTGGCDGCLNWKGMNDPTRSVLLKRRTIINGCHTTEQIINYWTRLLDIWKRFTQQSIGPMLSPHWRLVCTSLENPGPTFGSLLAWWP